MQLNKSKVVTFEIYKKVRIMQGSTYFQRSRSHLELPSPRSNFHAENPQMLVATVQNLVVAATWRPGFMHTWVTQ